MADSMFGDRSARQLGFALMSGNEERTQRSRIGDVRQRGFTDRTSVDEATRWIDDHSARLAAEAIDIREAVGRVLAGPVLALEAVPPSDQARADGYAVRSSDTLGAGDYNPLVLSLYACADGLPPTAAAPIAAGASLPRGADAVLPFETAKVNGATLEVFGTVAEGWDIERKGQQMQAGTTLIESGRALLPQDIGLFASLGIQHVQVTRRPRVRLVITGPKFSGNLKTTRDANGPMLEVLVARDGGVVESITRGADQYESIARAVAAPGVDVILVAGRTGTGLDDEAPLVIAEIGNLAIHGIALRPGGSAGMGTVGAAPVFLLPGDPLACLCAYEVLAGRLVRRLAGRSPEFPYPVREAEVGRKIVSAIGMVDLQRVRVVNGRAEPIGSAESGGLASAVRADGFVVVPAPLEGYAPGARVSIHIYRTVGTS
jgi:molybdopterin molybdotransferase